MFDGVIRAAVAPLYARPDVLSPQISQLVLGSPITVLERAGRWLRVQGEDGYAGWSHDGYVTLDGATPDPRAAFSLGAELHDPAGRLLARLPWGARVSGSGAGYRLPDGRLGFLAAGELIDADARAQRFAPCAENVARTSFRWLGAPYLWGGTTQNGVDCSGYVQAIFRVHGVPLPRDSRMQWRAGDPLGSSTALEELRPADLLFFEGESPQVSHVALSLGGGAMIHAALANGGVDVNDLSGESSFDEWLRAHFVGARRLLAG